MDAVDQRLSWKDFLDRVVSIGTRSVSSAAFPSLLPLDTPRTLPRSRSFLHSFLRQVWLAQASLQSALNGLGQLASLRPPAARMHAMALAGPESG